ncbi:MAG: hypothetical protein Q8O72_07620 [Bacteroidales bacterium]|jgi:hypothetical protein|nr:hypothetical protein [Bacteroidales bacterium]
MKKSAVFDILFIVVSATIFSLIVYFGRSNLISQFILLFALAAYFVGKYVGKLESLKNSKH